MAEHILETRLLLRYATYNQWMNSDLILKVGEPAVAIFPNNRTIENMSNAMPDYTPPAIGLKIGDGRSRFYQLPWVQAIAADVYQWAKAVTKPTYSANEIAGLDSYIEEHSGSGSGSGTAATRRYQIIQGTDTNINKYYLRYRDDDESNWTVDYNHYIDLEAYAELLDWIGNDINNFSSLGNRTDDHIMWRLSELLLNDIEQEHRFVTSVSQSNGKITVTKAQPTFDDIKGTLDVESGGTGATSFESGEVLVGNGTDPIHSIEISTSVENTRTLIYNYAVKAYVDAAVAGLTGAMHFIGEATVTINGAVNPQIADYDFSKAQPGDVILSESKEYVWTGSTWRLLGDEGSYAIKGSIRDVDIDADAAIQMSKISNLLEALAGKVDIVEGKQLSTNDYTNEDRQKLENIESGAQVNVIEHVFLNDTEMHPVTINNIPKSIDLHVREFDEDSATKLQLIEPGAQENRIEHITVDGTEILPNGNKTIAIVTDPHTEHTNVIEKIYINGTEYPPDQQKVVHITLDESALQLNIVSGAEVPGISTPEEIEVINKKLQLSRIAKTGNIADAIQTNDTYIILNCGTSTTVI